MASDAENQGPGDMLGLVSAEYVCRSQRMGISSDGISCRSFATPVRGTCYGLSAALGKTGAAVGTQAFTPIQNNLGKRCAFK